MGLGWFLLFFVFRFLAGLAVFVGVVLLLAWFLTLLLFAQGTHLAAQMFQFLFDVVVNIVGGHLLPSLEESRDSSLRLSYRSRETYLREVECIESANVILFRGGDRLLCLHELNGVGNSGAKPVSCLREGV